MRILLVAHGFPPLAVGGAEIYAHSHARAFAAAGDDVLVIAREADASRPEYATRRDRVDGVPVLRINNTFRATTSYAGTYENESIGAIAARAIAEFRPDVAHIHHLTCLSTTIVRALADRQIPIVFTLHDYWMLCHRGQLLDEHGQQCAGPSPSRCHACVGVAGGVGRGGHLAAGLVRAIERRLPPAPAEAWRQTADRAAAVIATRRAADDEAAARWSHMHRVMQDVTRFLAPSQHLRQVFVEAGVPPERIAHWRYGIDDRGLDRIARTRADRLRLGFLGTVMLSKAPDVLIEAHRLLPRGQTSVEIFGAYTPYHGDDSYRTRIEPRLALDGVHQHGSVPHADIARVFSSIDVLVVPSIWPENSPLVIQEARLAGIPVVASRIGGIPELIVDGVSGLLFEPGNPDDLADKVRLLVEDPGLRERLARAPAHVRSLDDDVKATRALYASLSPASRLAAERTPRLAAIVLNYRAPDDTAIAVRALQTSERPIDDLIVVDNDVDRRCEGALGIDRAHVRYLAAGRNLGFSGGMNLGIRAALDNGADCVLLVNSDVVTPPDAVGSLERALASMPGAGIAGPVVLSRSDPDRIGSIGMTYRSTSGRMRHRAYGAHRDEAALPPVMTVDGVSGCFMLVRKDVFVTVGLLDERFFFAFEDLEFCLRARRAGLSTVLAGAATVFHEGGQSIGPTSPYRLYFAARNHLLMARSAGAGSGRLASIVRGTSIVAFNVAHAVRARGGTMRSRLAAVARGTRDHFRGAYGSGGFDATDG